MSIEELHEYHHNSNHCFFMAYNGNIREKYFDLYENTQLLKKFLKFQLNDSEENVKDFLETIYRTLNRQNGKKNHIMIIGPPSCFKSWFVEILQAYCMKNGNIQNMTKVNSFPFSDCVHSRMLSWDEPQFNIEWTETLKLIFGGNPAPISVKYQNNVIMRKVPIIITSKWYFIEVVDVDSA